MNPTISVIIPTYQCAQYLRRALESIRAQTYPAENIETIVVDDGSTDDTGEVIKPYLSWVKYIYKSNAGCGAARNTGIRASNGDYLAFLDADDYWFPRRLERMLPLLEGQPRVIVQDDYFKERDGRRSGPRYGASIPPIFSKDADGQYHDLLREHLPAICQAIMHRTVFDTVGLFDERFRHAEDLDLWLRCFKAGYVLRLLAEPHFVYTIRAESLSHGRYLRKAVDVLLLYCKHPDAIEPEMIAQGIGSVHYHAAREAFMMRDWRVGGSARHYGSSKFGLVKNRTAHPTYAKGWSSTDVTPLVSVIIPTYQCGPYLARALDSVFSQTYPTERIELIVVDDGSTDDTRDVMRRYLRDVRYIRQENAGVAAARNAGLKESRGDLIALLDADDYWFPERLQRSVAALHGKERTVLQNDYFLELNGQRPRTPRFGDTVPFQFALDAAGAIR